jgi:hypothetical protein
MTPLTAHPDRALSGKLAFKVADPSGNIIEFKHYPDPAELLAREASPGADDRAGGGHDGPH